ncbi:hypothetical protein ACFVYP_16825 [Kitasatospora sp. NPDC058201]|uniref:hypothetical protein n=1 Tax=unclassified Kitasatospora TaxID=2633591 RepID=UPI00364F2A21
MSYSTRIARHIQRYDALPDCRARADYLARHGLLLHDLDYGRQFLLERRASMEAVTSTTDVPGHLRPRRIHRRSRMQRRRRTTAARVGTGRTQGLPSVRTHWAYQRSSRTFVLTLTIRFRG